MISKASFFLVGVAALALTGPARAEPATLSVLIENVSTGETLPLPSGKRVSALIAPGVLVVHKGPSPVFAVGRRAGPALEALAEEGNPKPLAALLDGKGDVSLVRIFVPGQPIEISALPGERISIATMFVESNDLFYAAKQGSLALFDATGRPLLGDRTAELALFDAGTEVNEAPGVGSHQPSRQRPGDPGASERGVVRAVNDGFAYPPTSAVVKMTISGG